MPARKLTASEPFLVSALDMTLDDINAELRKLISITPAIGNVHSWPSVIPRRPSLPFGTVLKPKGIPYGGNVTLETRLMVIGWESARVLDVVNMDNGEVVKAMAGEWEIAE